MYYAICPKCGHKLLKADNGTRLEMYCPKCKTKLGIIVKDEVVIIGKFDIKDTIEIE